VIDEYTLFAQVVQAGSLSAAGRRLRLSPAMVSKRLSRLEERLGTRLIHRTTRRLATTPAGQQFYEDVVRILDASRGAEELVTGRQGTPSGTLRVSAPTSFGRLHVAPHLKAFLDRYPAVRMELELDDTFSDLIADRIDLAIRIGAGTDGGLTSHHLAANRRVLCASPEFIARHGAPKTLKQLLDFPLLAAAGQMPWRLEGPEGPVSVAGESCLKTNSSEVVRELAVAGMGVALRSTWDVWRDLGTGGLVRVLPAYSGATDVAIFAAHPSASLVMPNVPAFVQFLQDLYARPSWEGAGPPG
jgi:DNA-binding transcriptional LysR family regulator